MKLKALDTPVAVLIPPHLPPAQLAPLAKEIEQLGFADIWTAEDYFELAGFSSAAIMLGATERLRVGIGIVSAVARHPAVTAMEFATIGNAFPGRIIAGIGHGVPLWTKQMGLYPKSPLKALRECCGITRRLLDGEEVTQHEGHFYCDKIRLSHPCPEVKIVTGVIGPKSLQLSAEVADGVLTSVMATPEYIDFAREHLSAGAEKAGKDEQLFPLLAIYSVDKDRAVARRDAGKMLAHYVAATGATPLTGALGWNDKAKELQEIGDPDQIYRELPDEWIDRLTISGTADECAEKIRVLLDAGASQVGVACADPAKMSEQIRILSDQILPKVG